jgi:hypothetical protein
MKRHDVLGALIRTLVILNVVDLLCTLLLVGNKLTTEENPIMDIALQRGPMTFGAVKLGVTLVSAGLLWFGRRSKWAIPATLSLLIIMGVVVFVQLIMVMQLSWGG